MSKKDIEIEYINISDLKPYENNAKKHPAEQVEQIKKSITEYGMNDPIAIWKDNIIVEGHGRYMACLELGIEEVPVIRLENMTEEQRRAYALVHNSVALETGFDHAKLEKELEEIGVDLSAYGLNVDLDNVNFVGIDDLFGGEGEQPTEQKDDEGKYCKCPYCGERVKI